MNLEYEILLQRILRLETEMQQVRAREINPIDVKVGSFTCPAATGYKKVTGVGFKPRCVEFTVGRYCATDFYSGIGWMDYNGNQKALDWTHDADGNVASDFAATKCLEIINKVGDAAIVDATYVSMNSDGFTINFVTVDTNFTIGWKATR